MASDEQQRQIQAVAKLANIGKRDCSSDDNFSAPSLSAPLKPSGKGQPTQSAPLKPIPQPQTGGGQSGIVRK